MPIKNNQGSDNIPQLRFPEFKGEWEKKKLGDEIYESGYGPRFSGEDYSIDGNVKTIRGTDIALNGEILYDQVPLAYLNENFIKNHILEDGDLVMITTADCGLTGVFRKQEIHYIPSAYAVKIRLKKSANSEYFKYLLQTTIAYNQVNKFIRKATIGNLPGSDILKFEFRIPTLTEQTKIAEFFTAIDAKIQALKTKKEKLQQYKKGVMQQLFCQNQDVEDLKMNRINNENETKNPEILKSSKSRFRQDDGKPFPNWELKKLGEVFYSEKGKGISKDKIILNGKFECVLYGELYTKYNEVIFEVVSKTNEIDGIKSKIGDLLIPSSTTTTGIDLANVTALNKNDVLLGGDITVLRSNLEINNIFYAYYLSNYKKDEIASYAQGSTIVHLYYNHIKDMYIDLPCLEEQTKIANFLSSIDEKINHTETQIQQTQTWKKGLLQQMFV